MFVVFGVVAQIPISALLIASILLEISTPTESAAVASFFALLIGKFVYREFDLRRIGVLLVRNVVSSSAAVLLVVAANMFRWITVYELVPQKIVAWITAIASEPFHLLLLLNALLLVFGMVIDPIAALILVAPILLPITQEQFGTSAMHFGVIACINLVHGLLTPPVGIGLCLASSLTGLSR